jgi:hypothetical protein
MTRTLLHIDAAACSHHDGDSEEACRRTVAALTGLPAGYRTGLVRRRAQDLYEAIPTEHHHERAYATCGTPWPPELVTTRRGTTVRGTSWMQRCYRSPRSGSSQPSGVG